jgi:TolA-binding protein
MKSSFLVGRIEILAGQNAILLEQLKVAQSELEALKQTKSKDLQEANAQLCIARSKIESLNQDLLKTQVKQVISFNEEDYKRLVADLRSQIVSLQSQLSNERDKSKQ